MSTASAAEFDSKAWRAQRDALISQWVSDPHAMECIQALGNISEVWDDFCDGDMPNRGEAMAAFRDALFGLERNPFWRAHRELLSFHVEQLALLWETANHLERADEWKVRSRGFFLRESANLLVPAVVSLLDGYGQALKCSRALWEFLPHEAPDEWEYRHEPRRK